jgi:dual specificity MAP kinase phosphatase
MVFLKPANGSTISPTGFSPRVPQPQENDAEGDSPMPFSSPPPTRIRERKILIHCTDGYTESTLLGLAYFTYATGLPVPTAWLDLHVSKGRNFFAYPSDVGLLTTIAPRLYCLNLLSTPRNPSPTLPSWRKMSLSGSRTWMVHFRAVSLITCIWATLGHANNPQSLEDRWVSDRFSALGKLLSGRTEN